MLRRSICPPFHNSSQSNLLQLQLHSFGFVCKEEETRIGGIRKFNLQIWNNINTCHEVTITKQNITHIENYILILLLFNSILYHSTHVKSFSSCNIILILTTSRITYNVSPVSNHLLVHLMKRFCSQNDKTSTSCRLLCLPRRITYSWWYFHRLKSVIQTATTCRDEQIFKFKQLLSP